MRANLIVLAACAGLILAGAASAQQAPPPAPTPGPIQPSEAQPLPIYQGTNGPVSPAQAPQAEPVYAVVAGHLVSGTAQPYAHGELALMDETRPDFLCLASTRGADVRLRCSDGTRIQLTTQAFTDDAGCGRTHAGANASLCYGFKGKYAARRLVAPAGQTLLMEYGHLALKPAA